MATRCQIGFYEDRNEKKLTNFDALIYRHYDGYPEAVLPDIVPTLKEFGQERGLDDVEYASAYLVAKLKTGMLNIGISKAFHIDIEYFYAVFPNGYIDVYMVDWNKEGCEDIPAEERLIKIQTLNVFTAEKTDLF